MNLKEVTQTSTYLATGQVNVFFSNTYCAIVKDQDDHSDKSQIFVNKNDYHRFVCKRNHYLMQLYHNLPEYA